MKPTLAEIHPEGLICPDEFPFTNKGAPLHIVCCDCGRNGWGPMLKSSVWESIATEHEQKTYGFFLCEPCMVDRLGRPLTTMDLRDCPMNWRHPLYYPTSYY